MDVTIVLPGRTKWCGKQQHKSFTDQFLIPFISLSSKTIDHLTSLKGYLLLFFNNKCDVIITVAQEIVAPYKHTYTHTHIHTHTHARTHAHTLINIPSFPYIYLSINQLTYFFLFYQNRNFLTSRTIYLIFQYSPWTRSQHSVFHRAGRETLHLFLFFSKKEGRR